MYNQVIAKREYLDGVYDAHTGHDVHGYGPYYTLFRCVNEEVNDGKPFYTIVSRHEFSELQQIWHFNDIRTAFDVFRTLAGVEFITF